MIVAIKDVVRKVPVIYGPLSYVRSRYHRWRLSGKPAHQVFEHIYRANAWGDPDSASGTGSNLVETRVLVAELPGLFRRLEVKSLLDVPCGDFFWMKEVALSGIDYLGGDIVSDIVEQNKKYQTKSVTFCRLDLVNDQLPEVDLVLVRDCLVHLSYSDALRALRNVCDSGAKYLLSTTFAQRTKNADIATGQWRPLNLQLAPFNLPAPVEIINEQHPDSRWSDKSLALWETAQVRTSLNQCNA